MNSEFQLKARGNNPVNGFLSLFSALELLFKPGLKRYIFMPLLINISFFVFAFFVGWHYFGLFMDSMLDFSKLWDWVAALLNFIRPLLWFLFVTVYLVIVFYTFTILANIIAAPFNSLLAEATEAYLRGKPLASTTSITQLLKDVIPLIWQEISKLLYFILRAIPLLILFVIPLTTLIAPFLWFIFNAWMMSLQYMDYPMGNHLLKFKQQRQLQAKQRWYSMGYGGGVLLATMIPVINFIIIPLAVVTATKNWVERFEKV